MFGFFHRTLQGTVHRMFCPETWDVICYVYLKYLLTWSTDSFSITRLQNLCSGGFKIRMYDEVRISKEIEVVPITISA